MSYQDKIIVVTLYMTFLIMMFVYILFWKRKK